ncbi:MAG: rhodanese-like domain-containing protein [Actinomycetota bacterium]
MKAGTVVVDVRTPGEYAQGHLTGAVNVDMGLPPSTAR